MLERILLVEDEDSSASSIQRILRDNGFQVDAYNDPNLVLQNFKSNAYGLIILSVAMHGTDGFRLYQEMKKKDDSIKVFFVTSFKVNYQLLRELFSGGGIDINDESISAILADTGGRFLRKPIPADELVRRVNAELEQKRRCKYCGWHLDEADPEVLAFLHSECWKEYRKNGILDPMPENSW
jgi:CheY-like chemotaxis protein